MADIRLFIVSNEALSQSSSNGRTLWNIVKDIPSENLAQFYLRGNSDKKICLNNYRVSDRDALNAFLHRKGRDENISSEPLGRNKEIKRTCRNMVLRTLVWKSYCWWKKDFDGFIDNFNPNVVLLQAGDSPFMFAIARKIAKKWKIPLIMYNSETYVLREKLYANIKSFDIFHKILQLDLKNEYKKFMKQVNFCIYATDFIENWYQKKYSHQGKSCALYTISGMQECKPTIQKDDEKTFLYCGNLGLERPIVLDEFAKTLYSVDEKAKLKVFGKFLDEDSEKLLCSNKNVEYGGFIPYEKVLYEIQESTMVIHCESPNRVEELIGGFTTKIADCLACGKPFLVYATRKYPFVQYLESAKAAHIADNQEELKILLEQCIKNENFQNQYLENAKKLAQKNHNANVNRAKFKEILEKVVGVQE